MLEQGFPIDADWHPSMQTIVSWWATTSLLIVLGAVTLTYCFLRLPSRRVQRMLCFLIVTIPVAGIWLVSVSWRTGIGTNNVALAMIGLWFASAGGLIVWHQRAACHADSITQISSFVVFIEFLFLCTGHFPGNLSREAARRSQCRNNLKQIGLAVANYVETNRCFPSVSNGDVPLSWRVLFLPYLDSSDVFERYDQSATWDSERNTPIAQTIYQTYICPSRWTAPMDAQRRYFTDYVMPSGNGTIASSQIKDWGKITDGSSNTLLVTEASGLRIVWTEPRDIDIDREPVGINLKGPTSDRSPGMVSSHHREGGLILLADGSVKFIDEKTDPTLLKQLAVIADGAPQSLDP